MDPKDLELCIYFSRFSRYSRVGAFLEKHISFLRKCVDAPYAICSTHSIGAIKPPKTTKKLKTVPTMSHESTEGLWQILPGGPGESHVISNGHTAIAHVLPIGDRNEQRANAYLIVRSRDLLVAVKDLSATLASLAAKHQDGLENLVGSSLYNAKRLLGEIERQ